MSEIEKGWHYCSIRNCSANFNNICRQPFMRCDNNINRAFNSLENQIPYKPMEMQSNEPEYMCKCGYKLIIPDKYCRECGQKLDWSEINA